MATVTKSTPVGNPKSLSEQIQAIEDRYASNECYTSEGLKNTIDSKDRQLCNWVLSQSDRERLNSEVEDDRVVLDMAKCYEDAIALLKSLFLADQLKEDHDFTVDQLAEAVESASTDTLPDEVRVEIQGDIIPMAPELDTCRLKFERMDKDEAVYSVHCL